MIKYGTPDVCPECGNKMVVVPAVQGDEECTERRKCSNAKCGYKTVAAAPPKAADASEPT